MYNAQGLFLKQAYHFAVCPVLNNHPVMPTMKWVVNYVIIATTIQDPAVARKEEQIICLSFKLEPKQLPLSKNHY